MFAYEQNKLKCTQSKFSPLVISASVFSYVLKVEEISFRHTFKGKNLTEELMCTYFGRLCRSHAAQEEFVCALLKG